MAIVMEGTVYQVEGTQARVVCEEIGKKKVKWRWSDEARIRESTVEEFDSFELKFDREAMIALVFKRALKSFNTSRIGNGSSTITL